MSQINATLESLKNTVSECRLAQTRRESIISSIEEYTTQLQEMKEEKECYEEIREAVMLYLEQGKEKTKIAFEEINTTAISSIFGEGYEVELEYDQEKGRSSARIRVLVPLADGSKIPTSIEFHGGGFLDVISLTFYLCQLELLNPKPEGPLIADEPMKHLDEESSRYAVDVIRSIINPDGTGADGSGRQMLFSTHSPIFKTMADKVFQFKKKENEITEVCDITDNFIKGVE